MGAERGREPVVDRLRGIALLGVLLVNTPFLLTSVEGMTDASIHHWWDRLAALVTWTVFQAKSYVVFSFLFGYSLAILLDSLHARGIDATRAYGQRLLALFALGVLHAATLFVGDILVPYAVLGTLMLWLRGRDDRVVLRTAVALYAVQLAIYAAVFLVQETDFGPIAWIDTSWREDGFADATGTRLQVWPAAIAFVLTMQGPLMAALFALGLLAGRQRWLADPEANRATLVRVRRWGLLAGAPPQLLAGIVGTWPGIDAQPALLWGSLVLTYATAPVLSAGFVAAIALLPTSRATRLLEAEGRMSLTIYLAESLLLTTLAAGWGLGFYGMSTGTAFAVAVAVWCLLVSFAHGWGARYGQGPAERLLRRLTFAGLRRRDPPAAGRAR